MENGHYGNVLVKMSESSEWQGVCDDYWGSFGTQNAEVICRMLGFPGAISYTMHSAYGAYLNSDIFALDDIQCQGYEVSLEDCYYSTWENCGLTEYAGVECNNTGSNCNPRLLVLCLWQDFFLSAEGGSERTKLCQ